MSSLGLDKIWLYRIVHYKNIKHILRNGLYTRKSINYDPNYINIGQASIISKRDTVLVKIPPYGLLNDYIPFYFGGHSPMLLNIITGWGGMKMFHQKEIVYLICSVKNIIDSNCQFVFTNGHALDKLTEYYNKVEDLKEIDWKTVTDKNWKSTEDDLDKFRRKQAEFLVKEHVPVECIEYIVCFSDDMTEIIKKSVQSIQTLTMLKEVRTSQKLFY